ncbi:MAG: MMPL family transporter, partial [Nocardioides sp.]
MGKALHHLGKFCARWPWAALGIWAALAAAVVGLVVAYGPETSNDLELPGTESQQVQDLLTDRFPPQQNGVNPIVFHVEDGKLTAADNKQAVKDAVKGLRDAPHVYSVTNPLSNAGQTAGLLSDDKKTAFAPVLLDVGSADLDEAIASSVFDATEPASSAGIQVEAAGSIGTELSDQATESSEVVGILCAMFILTLVLGSLIAMGMPIITAVVGLAFALASIGLMGHLIAVPDTGATLATMIGLGVGIDYALFMVTRHQQHLEEGMPVGESIAKTVATSGSAIVFAGGTVVVALVALRVAKIPLLSTLGLASAVAVLTAVLPAITFLPAVLALLGHRIHWLSLPAFMRRKRADGGVWGRWAGFVT